MAVIIDGTNGITSPVVNSTNGISLNNSNVSANFTVSAGNNAISVGPVTLNANVVVTVVSGQKWVVL
jgi:hypothetical protein